MRKVKIAFIILIIYLPFWSICQNIEWKEQEPLSSKYYIPKVVGQDENSVYCFSLVITKTMFEKFNKKSGKRVFSIKLIHPDHPKGKPFGLFINDKGVFVFIEEKDKSENCVYSFQIDTATGESVPSTIKEILRVHNNILYYPINEISISPDYKKVLISHKEDKKYTFIVLDKELNTLKSIEDSYYGLKTQGYGRYFINNEGSVFCLGFSLDQYTYDKDPSKFTRNVTETTSKTYDLAITFDANQDYKKNSINIQEIGVNNKWDNDFEAIINKKGKLIMVGFIIEPRFTRLSIAEIASDGTKGMNNYWTDDSLKNSLGMANRQRGDIDKCKIIENNEGKIFIIAQIGTGGLNNGKFYNDIFVIGINNDYKLLWKKNIDLRQKLFPKIGVDPKFANLHYMFFATLKGDNPIVLYNDNILNETNPNPAENVYKESESGIIVICNFDSNTGNLNRTVEKNQNKDNLQFIPKSSSSNITNDIMVLFRKSNDYISIGTIR